MLSDTLLEEDEKRRLDSGPPASDTEMAQMAGTGQLDDAPEAPPDVETAPPPAPAPESAPESKPATAVDLLAQVKQGQITRPAVDAAFGGAKLADAPGIDWKGLSDRLASARSRAGTAKTVQTVFANAANPGRYVEDTHAGDEDVAAAEDELKLGQAQHAQGIQDSQEADRKAGLQRQTEADKLRAELARIGWAQKAKDAELKAAGDKSKADMEGEHRAVDDQRREEELTETRRHNLATEGNASHGIDARAKAAADKAKAKGGAPAPIASEGDYSKVPERLRDRVKNIVEEGGILPTATKGDEGAVRSYVYQVAPHYDPRKAEAFGKLQNDLTSGADAGKIHSLNVAIGHLADLEDSLPSTSDSQMWNRIESQGLQAMGSTKYEKFNATRQALAAELTKAYGIINEHEAEGLKAQLGSAKTKEQLQTVIQQYRHLLNSPIEEYKFRWGSMAPKGREMPLLNPKAEASMARDSGSGGGVGAQRFTPTGKPYAKSQTNTKTGKKRYLDEAGNVVDADE